MRTLLFLLTLPLLAETVAPAKLYLHDGSAVAMPDRNDGSYIVEFHEPPLAVRGAVASTSQRETLTRFRRDLDGFGHGAPAANVATPIDHEYFRVFHGVSVRLDDDTLARVRALPYVKAVHANEVVEGFQAATTNTPLTMIGGDRFWETWKTRGAGVVVAIIDSGIDSAHPALAGKVIGGWDFVDDDDDPSDERGHGTFVAGIVAGESADVQGVAPDAKLLSYRVLNDEGRGDFADVIAALERAVDPNGDGDLSDRADVVNLSLGNENGDADSPASLAVDRAVGAGVVVSVAAGNTGTTQSIGTPAASRLGITVGATDLVCHQVASFSSFGPAFPDLALKPEILAPGEGIVSANIGGGTRRANGTSVAAAYVSGAAALLRALHPSWSPAEVKEAIVGTARGAAGLPMARGGGIVNVFDSATSAISVTPPVLSFGSGPSTGWSRTRTVRVTNRGPESRTFTAVFDPPGYEQTLVVTPTTFTLEPGASQDVDITFTVSAVAVGRPETMALFGQLDFRTDDASATLVWNAYDGAKVHLRFDAPGTEATPWWICEDGTRIQPRRATAGGWMRLLPHRRCGLTVFSTPASDARTGESALLFEEFVLTDDLTLQRSPSDTAYVLDLAGVDAEGSLLRPGATSGARYYATWTFDTRSPSLFAFTRILVSAHGSLRASAIPGIRVSASEVLFDLPRRRIVAVHHQPLSDGIRSDAILRSLPADLYAAQLEIPPQGAGVRVQPSIVWTFRNAGERLRLSGGEASVEKGWHGHAYVTALPPGDGWGSPAFVTLVPDLPSPQLGLLGGGIYAIDGRLTMGSMYVFPTDYTVAPGGTLVFGEAPSHGTVSMSYLFGGVAFYPSFRGPSQELSEAARRNLTWELRDARGVLVAEGDSSSAPGLVQPLPRGGYSATVRSGSTEIVTEADLTVDNPIIPSLRSLRIVGEDGVITSHVAPGERVTLVFEDYAAAESRVFWRANGDWQPLNGNLLPTTVFGPIDLRVQMQDAYGNRSTVTMNDAYSVGGRRRAARR